jgi:hypothetical protein
LIRRVPDVDVDAFAADVKPDAVADADFSDLLPSPRLEQLMKKL